MKCYWLSVDPSIPEDMDVDDDPERLSTLALLFESSDVSNVSVSGSNEENEEKALEESGTGVVCSSVEAMDADDTQPGSTNPSFVGKLCFRGCT